MIQELAGIVGAGPKHKQPEFPHWALLRPVSPVFYKPPVAFLKKFQPVPRLSSGPPHTLCL
uniref:Uncharacterized protein n=1 Tax=Magnetospirillum gryphiswaldense TaxID=55518 RepID=A4TUR0_9PROT|nr:hypothetical protein MGR_1987 [Magnetospirillum gryphiswaldense MSR-1]